MSATGRLTGVVLLGLWLAGGSAGKVGESPNLLLISVGALGPSALRPYDSRAEKLPAIDALASESLVFENALSTAPWTLPANASLLTGLYPDRHGAVDPRVAISEAAPRLARTLRSHGYQTVAFADGGFLSPAYGFDRGFDDFHPAGDAGIGSRPVGAGPSAVPPSEGPSARRVFDRAIAHLANRPADAPPFFLFVQTYALRDYYRSRPWATALLPARVDPDPRLYLECLTGMRRCPPDLFERLAALYGAELPELDRNIGRLLHALRATELDDDTVVALVSDHGESFDVARRRIHHGGRLHADQLRVPFFLRIPGVRARAIREPVSLVDLTPTLVELNGASPPAHLDGESLVPLVDGRQRELPRAIFAMEHRFKWADGVRLTAEVVSELPVSVAVLKDRYWLILEPGSDAELYDLRDLDQERNLAVGAGRQEQLKQLQLAISDRLRARSPTRGAPVADAVRERMRASGHIE